MKQLEQACLQMDGEEVYSQLMSIYLVSSCTIAVLDHTSILHFTLYLLCEEDAQDQFKAALSNSGSPRAEKQTHQPNFDLLSAEHLLLW